jgi:hypothetical protein
MAQKLWATDTFDNAVRYSSVVNGPTDWTLPDDAGELPIGGHVSGNRVVTGLGQIESKLAVSTSTTRWKSGACSPIRPAATSGSTR